jgi:tyrosinase
LSQLPWTVRHWDPSTERSNISDVNAALEHQFNSVLPLTYRLFSYESDYTNISCTTSRGNSFENIHNLVHNALGGYGHMSDIAISAFDPIFWLHHTNIDRQFAMWQALNPHSYVVPTINPLGTYAVAKGSVETADTNLLPFHSDNGTEFWTSNEVRSTRVFGYAYRDVVDWNITQAKLASNVRANVNRLYNPRLANGFPRSKRLVSARNKHLPGAQHDPPHLARTSTSINAERQWTITVQVQRFAYHSPFLIDFFVGTPPISPLAWPTATNLVGSHAQFIATKPAFLHPDSFLDALNHGEVSLTHCLFGASQSGVFANLEPDAVIPFLTKSLNWRARDMEGCEVELDSLAALSIGVGSQVVKRAKFTDEFPTYGELEIYANITAGKPGGVGQELDPNHGYK